ncbi:MAG: SAM-dependent methyltransferase [Cellvibrionaceae bacterium]|jgi:SAM-dependent methyltransferase
MIEVPCNFCGSDNYTVKYPSTMNGQTANMAAFRCTTPDYGIHGRIVQCSTCNHVYTNPVQDGDELLELYAAVEDEIYVEERIGRRLTFKKHLDALEKVTGPGNGRTILDIGAYIGIFVEVAREQGWDATGVDPSDWAVEYARKAGLPVIHGTSDHPEFIGKYFDAVTMWDVIEHLADPLGELKKAYALLKPGGTLAVHTMDIDSLISKMMGGRWPWYMAMHVQFFSQKTMVRFLEKAGFEVIWTGTQGRYLRLHYLVSRLGGLNRSLGRFSDLIVHTLRIGDRAIPVNFGDLFTVYARRID